MLTSGGCCSDVYECCASAAVALAGQRFPAGAHGLRAAGLLSHCASLRPASPLMPCCSELFKSLEAFETDLGIN